MAAVPGGNCSSSPHLKPPSPSSSRNQLQLQHQSVSSMIKQGFIPDPVFLNPLSPPPNFRASPNPTLFEMMAIEQARESAKPDSDGRKNLQDRISSALSRAPFRTAARWGIADVKLTLAAVGDDDDDDSPEEGFRVSVDVHRRVLAARSRFFAERLRRSGPHSVEILDCDDVAAYLEAIVLMYLHPDELKTSLLEWDVSKVLSLLKICSAVMFEDGIASCLEFLEAVPWSEEEQDSVVTRLNELRIDASRTDPVLQRLISSEPSTSSTPDEVFLKLSSGVLDAKDEKARRQMKALVFDLLRDDRNNNSSSSSSKKRQAGAAYGVAMRRLFCRCLDSLIACLSAVSDSPEENRGARMAEIGRRADNLQWIVGILIDRKMGEEVARVWADQEELAALHSRVPAMYRHEISRVTAQLCVSIGKGEVLAPKETRVRLLSTWLEALYDDFAWMRAAMDRKGIEEGLCRTVLTLPLAEQQAVLLRWLDRYVDGGDGCPDMRRAFEIWWRRAFVKQYSVQNQMQITLSDAPE
ncbi:hypothetical protein M569_12618 [Genlisea aurea]|uniref:BTB domain-containing protein n=1 Tax=Genlisea aurea TaxID=192259 RepID=S8CCK8_9LAMI|nr:hypothetical protein M569_12618 [Genlisea aurea]